MDLVDVIAAHFMITRAKVLEQIPADVQPMVVGVGYMQGVLNFHLALRTKMRDIEAKFMAMTGQPWTRARYYSTEEAADDASVPVLRAMGLPPDGNGRMVAKLLPGVEEPCRQLVTSGAPIHYGENIDDNHHGACRRSGHIDALPKSGKTPILAPFVALTPPCFTSRTTPTGRAGVRGTWTGSRSRARRRCWRRSCRGRSGSARCSARRSASTRTDHFAAALSPLIVMF
jgi:hypothetical protein